jgi:hypothetical protein
MALRRLIIMKNPIRNKETATASVFLGVMYRRGYDIANRSQPSRDQQRQRYIHDRRDLLPYIDSLHQAFKHDWQHDGFQREREKRRNIEVRRMIEIGDGIRDAGQQE